MALVALVELLLVALVLAALGMEQVAAILYLAWFLPLRLAVAVAALETLETVLRAAQVAVALVVFQQLAVAPQVVKVVLAATLLEL